MKTLKILVILALSTLLLVSCVNLDKLNADGSPAWTTDVPKTLTTYYAAGSAKLSMPQTSYIRAEAFAKDQIARWASTKVQGSIDNYIEEGGEALKDSQVLEMLTYLSVQTVNISLRGVEVEAQWTAEDQTVWVLLSYPISHLKEAYKLQAEELERKLELKKAEAQAEAQVALLQAQIQALNPDQMEAFFSAYIDAQLEAEGATK